jgi:hypothetical protein
MRNTGCDAALLTSPFIIIASQCHPDARPTVRAFELLRPARDPDVLAHWRGIRSCTSTLIVSFSQPLCDALTHSFWVGGPYNEKAMKMVDRIVDCSTMVTETLDDADGAWATEVQAISGPNEFSEFYSRLKMIRERHRRGAAEVRFSRDVFSNAPWRCAALCSARARVCVSECVWCERERECVCVRACCVCTYD